MTCAICGRTADEHHRFEAALPPGCQCSPDDWYGDVPPVCSAADMPTPEPWVEVTCKVCGHLPECHQ